MKIKLLFVVISLSLIFSCKDESVKVLPPQKIKVYKVTTKTVPIYEEFVGQVFGEKDIPIRARVEGFLDEIHFKEGSNIEKGKLLYVINPDPQKEAVVVKQSMVAQANTLLIQKESDLNRIKPLAALDAVSKRELDMAQAKRDAAISSLKAANADLNIAKINLSYTRILSPIDGIIGRTLAREGEFVGKNPNPVILNTVSDISNIRVQFFLSENEYLRIAEKYSKAQIDSTEGAEVKKIAVELYLSNGSLFDQKGLLDFIDRNIDTSTGTILVQATFPNPDKIIRPGQFVIVKVKVMDLKDALLVPQKCLIELQGQYSVLIVNKENKIETVQVVIGEKIPGYTIIKSGIKSDDQVILEGLQKAKPGLVVIPVVTEYKNQSTKKK
ncbi:MAG: efflux RND transporter periplasmic adaptor subunit [Flavobacteriaceae bacterium]|jgi:membrane fusion protein (multidrug efflux system)|nr:efflux RND transporter periplasmic adaptor subunit [Flavobacteriaceae bacterium]MBT3919468.1 efflux RND transporter periplasmic adaptor subunit [Flavobacteriaceae bacterium]MBT6706059.1 efflux RND transporter periplasmic adaptor subunit [Flavobacteriaceae bacterium]MBT7242309.1 efflux RND transporter periplasmic adaptor subunit [Flavobacteriaceae bacterium]